MGSHSILIRIIDKSDLYLMSPFTENYSLGEEHITAEIVRASTASPDWRHRGCFSQITQCFTHAKLIQPIWLSKQQQLRHLICSTAQRAARKLSFHCACGWNMQCIWEHSLGSSLQQSCVSHHFAPTREEGSATLTPDEAIPGVLVWSRLRCFGEEKN